MSQENVEFIRDFLNTSVEVDEGLTDPQRLNEFLTPDARFDLGAFSALVGRGEIRGVDDFFDFRAKPGKPHDSDSWVEMHYGFVYTVQDRLIRRAEAYATPDEALEAAGLRVE